MQCPRLAVTEVNVGFVIRITGIAARDGDKGDVSAVRAHAVIAAGNGLTAVVDADNFGGPSFRVAQVNVACVVDILPDERTPRAEGDITTGRAETRKHSKYLHGPVDAPIAGDIHPHEFAGQSAPDKEVTAGIARDEIVVRKEGHR